MNHDQSRKCDFVQPTRRAVLLAIPVGVTALAVAGCDEGAGGLGPQPAASAAPPPESGAGSAGTALGPLSDVPIGGGKVYSDQKVVVTQPEAGTFKAFSAVCTHQGCSVNQVADGTINCPCHGSKFKIQDGSVSQGPAERPLTPEQVTADGGILRLP